MSLPLTIGDALAADDWRSVRFKAMFDCYKWDIQSQDHCVLAEFPLFLEETEWLNLAELAEALAEEALCAERELFSRPDLYSDLGLPTEITQALRKCSAGDIPVGAARVMRFDFHLTTEGWRISEVNADVPGGFIEASGFTELMSKYFPNGTAPPNLALAYAEALLNCVGENGLVGLVHATAHVDDAQVMQYLAKQIRSLGMRAVLLSPEHIVWEQNRSKIVCAFASGDPNVLVRFFPAEWLFRLRPASKWKSWFCRGRTPMSNPGSAILIQSKRFPLIWDKLSHPMATWRSLMPESRCPSKLNSRPAADWVFKPVFGRVGEDVAIAGITEEKSYQEILRHVARHPKYWVAQRRFDSIPLPGPSGPVYPCLGIFTLDGRAVGAYGRIARKPLIDHNAQDIAVLLTPKGNGRND